MPSETGNAAPRYNRSFDTDAQVLTCASRARLPVAGQLPPQNDMTDRDSLEAKLQDAAAATGSFTAVLAAEGFSAWAERFKGIQAALEASDTKTALHLFRNTRHAGMGSLSDIMVENQAHFDQAWGRCGKAMDNLRVLLEYDIDRPPDRGGDA